MSAQNVQLARLALAGLSARDRQMLVRELTGQAAETPPDRLLRPKAAAERLGVTPRTIFTLLRDGTLNRVRLPGRTRALGVRASELEAIISGNSR